MSAPFSPRAIPEPTARSWRRFLDSVHVVEDGCWEWTKRLNSSGYGLFYLGHRKSYAAHRVSYFFHNGVDPGGMCVCHTCDNRICVNPEHLWLGSIADNNLDALEKGRIPPNKGEKNGRAKLTVGQIREIRNSPKSGRQLAREMGVTFGSIYHVRQGRTWRHVA